MNALILAFARRMIRRAIVKGVTAVVAAATGYAASHFGIHQDPNQIAATAYFAIDLLRHEASQKWPQVGAWLG